MIERKQMWAGRQGNTGIPIKSTLLCTAVQFNPVEYSATLCSLYCCQVLSLYLDERRGVQGNTSMRSREFPRAQPEGTPETECWYFPVLPDSSQGTDIIQFIKVMKL